MPNLISGGSITTHPEPLLKKNSFNIAKSSERKSRTDLVAVHVGFQRQSTDTGDGAETINMNMVCVGNTCTIHVHVHV